MAVNTVNDRTQASFRLRSDLVSRLKTEAKRENTSLDSYVERLLLIGIGQPHNAETMAAIDEMKAGKYAGTLDVSSFEAFMKSVNDIE